jgi:uncharacterized protein (DUF1684 family)
MTSEEYLHKILQWREEMDADLRRENGWLAVAGLFWMKQGVNTFGSSRDCDILFPKQVPRLMGAFELDGTTVTLHLDIGQHAELNGEPIESTAVLKSEQEDPPSFVKFGDLRAVILRHADKVGLRLWDNTRPERRTFPPRTWFPVSEVFSVPAHYVPYPIPMKIKVPNVFGEMEDDYVQGYTSFKLSGKFYRLYATELEGGRLYFQFQDHTNGNGTYPLGRYLYTEAMEEDGWVNLDFNKAYNPPSAFSEYAICSFSTKLNRLKVPIEAGEMISKQETI